MDSRRILLVLCVAIGLARAEAFAGQSGPSPLGIVIHNQADLPADRLAALGLLPRVVALAILCPTLTILCDTVGIVVGEVTSHLTCSILVAAGEAASAGDNVKSKPFFDLTIHQFPKFF